MDTKRKGEGQASQNGRTGQVRKRLPHFPPPATNEYVLLPLDSKPVHLVTRISPKLY
jgi:hypothetical protein